MSINEQIVVSVRAEVQQGWYFTGDSTYAGA
jgi:hypothetical protein